MVDSKAVRSYAFFVAAIIGFIAALVTLGIVVSLIALAIATLLFIPILRKQQRLHRGISRLRDHFEPIFGGTTGGQLKILEMLPEMMRPRSEYTNAGLGFERLIFKAEISKTGTYSGEYRARGTNLDSRPCRALKVLLGAASTWRLKKQPVRARDATQERELSVSSFKHLFSDIVGFDILFHYPLMHGQEFDISWAFKIPNACDTRYDIDIFLMWPYKGKIERVDIDITLRFAARDIRLYVIDNKFKISAWKETAPTINEYTESECRYVSTINKPDRYHAFVLVFNCNT